MMEQLEEIEASRRSVFDNLNIDEEERSALLSLFETVEKRVLKKKAVVPIEEFLDSDYYLGANNRRLYDFWKKEITDLFNNGQSEWIIEGSIRSGKTTAASAALIRKLYELSCLGNIQTQMGLMGASTIYFVYFSVSRIQAMLTGFGMIREWIDQIPYFRENFPRDERIDSILKFPSNLAVVSGSSQLHTIGMDLYGSVLDEANFHRAGGVDGAYQKVFGLYEDIVIRRKTTFTIAGRNQGLSVLATSSDTKSSFAERRIELAQADTNVKVTKAVVYKVKPKGTFLEKEFLVFKGTDLIDPAMVQDSAQLQALLNQLGYDPEWNSNLKKMFRSISEEYKEFFESVPGNFYGEFERDVVSALRKISGVSTVASSSFFKSIQVFNENVVEGVHPFSKESVILTTKDEIGLENYWQGQIKDKSAVRCVHIDQSVSKDATGVAMTHVSGVKRVGKEDFPIVKVDFMLQVKAPNPPYEIPITRIRKFFLWLKGQGVKFHKITYDQYQSKESIQILNSRGIHSELLSVDKDDSQYLMVKDMMFDRRLEFYEYPPFRREWFKLVHDQRRRKIDHPPEFQKDVSDAVVASIWNSVESYRKVSTPRIRFL